MKKSKQKSRRLKRQIKKQIKKALEFNNQEITIVNYQKELIANIKIKHGKKIEVIINKEYEVL